MTSSSPDDPHFTFALPTRVIFESGGFKRLGDITGHYGERPFIVTGRHFARKTGLLDAALAQLPKAAVFNRVEEDPGTEICNEGAELCRRKGCDVVLAIGGGSAIDAAKAIAGLARNDGPCRLYFGRDKFIQGALPIVCVPTTAGSGSEVTRSAVLVDERVPSKRTIRGAAVAPRVALCDPLLTHTCPRPTTIYTGLDALSQAMEGYVSKKSTLIGDVLALEACRIIREMLPRAARDGHDAEARLQMMFASNMAGCVIAQSGTTLVHGMGYCFTLTDKVAHGLANALLLAPVFQFNARHAPERVAAIAEALGVRARPKPQAAAAAIGEALHGLFADLDISPAGSAAGVNEDNLTDYAETIYEDPYRYRNQIGAVTLDTLTELYQQAYRGELVGTTVRR